MAASTTALATWVLTIPTLPASIGITPTAGWLCAASPMAAILKSSPTAYATHMNLYSTNMRSEERRVGKEWNSGWKGYRRRDMNQWLGENDDGDSEKNQCGT